MLIKILILLFLLLNISLEQESDVNEDALLAVILLFRHGDRTPLTSWPTDPYFKNMSLWPEGYGQLNNKGKQRHYELGLWLRNRYDKFLPRIYSKKDIYVRSTDVDRTLMSAACNLAGLYTPEDKQIWNEEIPWQPIPIHTVPEDEDTILAAEMTCAKRTKLKDELLKSEEYKKLNEENSDLYKILSNYTGLNITSVSTVSMIHSTLTIEREYNLTLPAWADEYFPKIFVLAAKAFQLNAYNTDLARLRKGPFFHHLIHTFENILSNSSSAPRKILMLSAHDSTIGDVLQSMKAFNDAPPEFASTVFWELRRNSDNLTYINLLYKNSTNFVKLPVFNCSIDCEYNEFKNLLKPVTVDVKEWKKECSQ